MNPGNRRPQGEVNIDFSLGCNANFNTDQLIRCLLSAGSVYRADYSFKQSVPIVTKYGSGLSFCMKIQEEAGLSGF